MRAQGEMKKIKSSSPFWGRRVRLVCDRITFNPISSTASKMNCQNCGKFHVLVNLESPELLQRWASLLRQDRFSDIPFIFGDQASVCLNRSSDQGSSDKSSGEQSIYIELVSFGVMQRMIKENKIWRSGHDPHVIGPRNNNIRRILVTESEIHVPAEDLLSLSLYGWVSLAEEGKLLRKCLAEVAMGRLWLSRTTLEAHFPFHPNRHEIGLRTEVARTSDEAMSLQNILSKREKSAYELMKIGCSNADIADRLGVTLSTSKKHVHNVLVKLELRKRRQLIQGQFPSM